MGYVEQLMGTGEEIVMRSRQHWIALLRSALINGFIIIAAMALLLVVDRVLPDTLPQVMRDILTAATWVIVVFALIRFGWDSLQWWAEEYIITNRRVMQSEGIINKRTVDSSLEKVNDVVLIQSFFGRILG